MKKDFDHPLLDLDGRPLKDGDTPVTAKLVCVTALMATAPRDEPTGDEKLRRYLLAAAVHQGGVQDVTPENAVLLKQVVGRLYGPAVVGPVYQFLDA